MTGAFLGINLALFVLAAMAARRRAAGTDLWLWLAAGALGVLAGLRFFGHYYLQLLPPLVLLAAAALPVVSATVRRVATGAVALSAAVMCAVAFLPADVRGLLPYADIAAEVRRLTTDDDTVLVWGEFPEIYWAAGREPATRFIHTGFLTGNSGGRDPGTGDPTDGLPGAWAMLDRDLRTRPAGLIVDTSPAGIRNSHYYPLDRTSLWLRIQHDYTLIATLDEVRFYRYVGWDPGRPRGSG